jgi:hypothetical protein
MLNHVTRAKAEAIADAILSLGLTPDKTSGLPLLEMVLAIAEMRFAAGDHAGALAAASIALPFCSHRLTAGTHEYAEKDDQALLLEAKALELRIVAVHIRLILLTEADPTGTYLQEESDGLRNPMASVRGRAGGRGACACRAVALAAAAREIVGRCCVFVACGLSPCRQRAGVRSEEK